MIIKKKTIPTTNYIKQDPGQERKGSKCKLFVSFNGIMFKWSSEMFQDFDPLIVSKSEF